MTVVTSRPLTVVSGVEASSHWSGQHDPRARNGEPWLPDPEGYLVVVAGPAGRDAAPSDRT
jgi:hypothetical protein